MEWLTSIVLVLIVDHKGILHFYSWNFTQEYFHFSFILRNICIFIILKIYNLKNVKVAFNMQNKTMNWLKLLHGICQLINSQLFIIGYHQYRLE